MRFSQSFRSSNLPSAYRRDSVTSIRSPERTRRSRRNGITAVRDCLGRPSTRNYRAFADGPVTRIVRREIEILNRQSLLLFLGPGGPPDSRAP